MTRDVAVQAYLQEATSWDADRVAHIQRSARIAWWTAGGGWACAMASSVALVLLMPLKRVDPFVIRVDNSTGIVDVVPVYAGKADFPEAVTRYLLTHYVTVCERFTFATAESDYHECGAFNGRERNQQWAALWTASNPSSPLNVYKSGGTVRVQVSAVSFFKRANGIADLAQVRYLRAERQGSSGPEHVTHWIANIQYVYAEPSKDLEIRKWNPLGLKVIEFNPEPEVASTLTQERERP